MDTKYLSVMQRLPESVNRDNGQLEEDRHRVPLYVAAYFQSQYVDSTVFRRADDEHTICIQLLEKRIVFIRTW